MADMVRMGFRVWFQPPALVVRDLPPSDGDYESVVIEACRVLAGTDCRFGVAGFGQAVWPVDVGYDLSTFVEQLPEAIAQIERGEAAEIDLYGQGIERLLRFEGSGERMRVLCTSRTSWTPDPAEESIARAELVRMLRDVAAGFAESLALMWPHIRSVEAACATLRRRHPQEESEAAR
jgi:hypothetical protein